MGSLSLIIVLIIVVWVIVLAPILMGNNKPIRHSGDGYDATRVLHAGGSEPLVQRRRPKLSAADVHRYGDTEDNAYEIVEAEDDSQVLLSGSTALSARAEQDEYDRYAPLDGEVVVEETPEPHTSGSTALSVLRAQEDSDAGEAQDYYEVEESFAAPVDYGLDEPYPTQYAVVEQDDLEDGDVTDGSEELTADEIAYAQNRRGRGGWDPERERTARDDRFRRRQRTLLGLIIADVIAFVLAFVAGGWAWLAPVITIALTVWFMVALRAVVRQERALHARRIRQLRRARMGVVPADAQESNTHQRRVPGAVIIDLDDESPDFSNVDFYRPAPETPSTPSAVRMEYDDYDRAS